MGLAKKNKRKKQKVLCKVADIHVVTSYIHMYIHYVVSVRISYSYLCKVSVDHGKGPRQGGWGGL